MDLFMVRGFNTLLSEMERCNRQEISKDIVELNNIINQLDIMGIYRLLHPIISEYTFFSNSHGTFMKIDHMLGCKHTLTNLKD